VFVVVGHANARAREVNLAACDAGGIPVLRRCSGGGTVVQMPGILNYALILRIPAEGPFATLAGTNRVVMERMRRCVQGLQPLGGLPVSVQGITDLCVGDRKVMGNAQRRRRMALLFHGSFLLSADLSTFERLLQPPSREPDYRKGRTHKEFCVNLGIPAAALRAALVAEWNGRRDLIEGLDARVRRLMDSRYARAEWHGKF
jgi:lipoate-protein ligase A